MTREQAKTFREQRLLEEQRKLAEQGISSAFEGKFLVTIGDSSCDYYNFKHFITTQVFSMGIDNFVEKTDWDKKEVIEESEEPEEVAEEVKEEPKKTTKKATTKKKQEPKLEDDSNEEK